MAKEFLLKIKYTSVSFTCQFIVVKKKLNWCTLDCKMLYTHVRPHPLMNNSILSIIEIISMEFNY